jgi:hypothetical protein
MEHLNTTKDAARRLGVSVWTVARTAKDHNAYTAKFPTTTGGYLFSEDDLRRMGEILNRPVSEVAA